MNQYVKQGESKMAITINRTISDGAQAATFELVSTGDAGGETGVALNVSSLSGGGADGRERVRVTRVQALVCGDSTNVTLEWEGSVSNTAFLTLPEGATEMRIACDPDGSSLTGNITFTSTIDTPFTLRVMVEKIQSFSGSMAKVSRL